MQSAFQHAFQHPFHGAEGGDLDAHGAQRQSTSDAIDVYFSCITTCSLDDGECVTRCVEELREG